MSNASIFMAIGLISICAGGLLMAFSAKKPSRLVAWASAYLVLIEGLAQLGLAHGWHRLGEPHAAVAVEAMIIFNLANLLVIFGTILRHQRKPHRGPVNLGGALLAWSMLELIGATWSRPLSWTLVWFLALVIVILISMPIGLMKSARRKI